MPPSATDVDNINDRKDVVVQEATIESRRMIPTPLTQQEQRRSNHPSRRRTTTRARTSSGSALPYRQWLTHDTPEAFLAGFLPPPTTCRHRDHVAAGDDDGSAPS
jgi:hypothetical protein